MKDGELKLDEAKRLRAALSKSDYSNNVERLAGFVLVAAEVFLDSVIEELEDEQRKRKK